MAGRAVVISVVVLVRALVVGNSALAEALAECSEASIRRGASQWHGFPVMPGFHSVQKAGPACLYAVSVPFAEAEDWHIENLTALGWEPSVRRRSTTTIIGGGPMVQLDFRRASDVFNATLIYSIREHYTMVMITRIGPES
jgi:hypothetical protein